MTEKIRRFYLGTFDGMPNDTVNSMEWGFWERVASVIRTEELDEYWLTVKSYYEDEPESVITTDTIVKGRKATIAIDWQEVYSGRSGKYAALKRTYDLLRVIELEHEQARN